jgi:hypothetical protein
MDGRQLSARSDWSEGLASAAEWLGAPVTALDESPCPHDHGFASRQSACSMRCVASQVDFDLLGYVAGCPS